MNRLALKATPSVFIETLRVSLGLKKKTTLNLGDVPKYSQRRGRFWALSAEQCAICAADASFSISNITTDPVAIAPSVLPTLGLDEDSVPQFPMTAQYMTSCGHAYCYACISERMIRTAGEDADGGGTDGESGEWECLRCESNVTGIARVLGMDRDLSSGSQDGMSDVDIVPTGDLPDDIDGVDISFR